MNKRVLSLVQLAALCENGANYYRIQTHEFIEIYYNKIINEWTTIRNFKEVVSYHVPPKYIMEAIANKTLFLKCGGYVTKKSSFE